MIYIDIIAVDTEDAIEITGKKDHNWLGLHDALSKPKVSLWQLWNIKKFIEKAYVKLEEGRENRKETFGDKEAKEQALKVQSSAKSARKKVGSPRPNNIGSSPTT